VLNIINTTYEYIQQFTEVVLSFIRNVVGICKQFIILILYEVSSRLITPFKFIYSSMFLLLLCLALLGHEVTSSLCVPEIADRLTDIYDIHST
jgi:hypothetical protein